MSTKPIDEELNRKLRVTLEYYKKIESPFLGLFLGQDFYARPPFFAFRFKDGTQEDYELLTEIIESFKGAIRWTMNSKEGFKNYMIEPYEFKEARDRGVKNDKLIATLGTRYYELCDKAYDDIEPLSQWIEIRFLQRAPIRKGI